MKMVVGDCSVFLGCLADNDGFIHIGALFVRMTACGKGLGDMLMSREVDITCPVCIKEIEYRSKHPEAKLKDMGILTHKGGQR